MDRGGFGRTWVLGRMLGSGLISFPPSPCLVVKDPQTKSFRILVELHLIDAEFRKAWMPYFCRSGHPVVTPDQFLDFVGHLLPQEPSAPTTTEKCVRLSTILPVENYRSNCFWDSSCTPTTEFIFPKIPAVPLALLMFTSF